MLRVSITRSLQLVQEPARSPAQKTASLDTLFQGIIGKIQAEIKHKELVLRTDSRKQEEAISDIADLKFRLAEVNKIYTNFQDNLNRVGTLSDRQRNEYIKSLKKQDPGFLAGLCETFPSNLNQPGISGQRRNVVQRFCSKVGNIVKGGSN